MTTITDYRQILKDEFSKRFESSAHKRYTRQAFAEDLGIFSTSLSDILNYKRGLSEKSARRVSQGLNLEGDHAEYFCQLVKATDSASRKVRMEAQKKVEALREKIDDRTLLDRETIKALSDWVYFAAPVLLEMDSFQNSPSWIAKRLKISEDKALEVVGILKTLGLFKEENGQLISTGISFRTPEQGEANIPIRKVHKQILEKASEAIEHQHPDERDFHFSFLAVNPKHIPMIKKKTSAFFKELMETIANDPDEKTQVYSFSTQLFEHGAEK